MSEPDPRSPAPPSTTSGAASAPVYAEGGRKLPPSRGWAWIVSGWRYFRRQPGLWILLILIFGALLVALQYVPVIGALATIVLVPVLAAGLVAGCQIMDRGGELELAHLFAGFRRNVGQLVLVGLIGFALTFAALTPAMLLMGPAALMTATGGGSAVAMGVTGMIGFLIAMALFVPVNMAVWFAPALVMLQDHSAPRAVAESFRGTLKNLAAFLLYLATLFVLGMIASIPFGLGWLVLGPVAVASVYAAYREIFTAG